MADSKFDINLNIGGGNADGSNSTLAKTLEKLSDNVVTLGSSIKEFVGTGKAQQQAAERIKIRELNLQTTTAKTAQITAQKELTLSKVSANKALLPVLEQRGNNTRAIGENVRERNKPELVTLRQRTAEGNILRQQAALAKQDTMKRLLDTADKYDETNPKSAKKIRENVSEDFKRGVDDGARKSVLGSFLNKIGSVVGMGYAAGMASKSIGLLGQSGMSAMQSPFLNNYNYGSQNAALQNFGAQQQNIGMSLGGTAIGAALGSFIPGIGTVIGGAVGGAVGNIAGSANSAITGLQAQAQSGALNNIMTEQSLQSTNAGAYSILKGGTQYKPTDTQKQFQLAIAEAAGSYKANAKEMDKLTPLIIKAQIPFSQVSGVTKSLAYLSQDKGFNVESAFTNLSANGATQNAAEVANRAAIFYRSGMDVNQAFSLSAQYNGRNPQIAADAAAFYDQPITTQARQVLNAKLFANFDYDKYLAGDPASVAQADAAKKRLLGMDRFHQNLDMKDTLIDQTANLTHADNFVNGKRVAPAVTAQLGGYQQSILNSQNAANAKLAPGSDKQIVSNYVQNLVSAASEVKTFAEVTNQATEALKHFIAAGQYSGRNGGHSAPSSSHAVGVSSSTSSVPGGNSSLNVVKHPMSHSGTQGVPMRYENGKLVPI
jgi:hypothetical protein